MVSLFNVSLYTQLFKLLISLKCWCHDHWPWPCLRAKAIVKITTFFFYWRDTFLDWMKLWPVLLYSFEAVYWVFHICFSKLLCTLHMLFTVHCFLLTTSGGLRTAEVHQQCHPSFCLIKTGEWLAMRTIIITGHHWSFCNCCLFCFPMLIFDLQSWPLPTDKPSQESIEETSGGPPPTTPQGLILTLRVILNFSLFT